MTEITHGDLADAKVIAREIIFLQQRDPSRFLNEGERAILTLYRALDRLESTHFPFKLPFIKSERYMVWVTHSFIGFHEWPAAPEGRHYLGTKHRHRFEVKMTVGVEDPDRQIEFHDLLAYVADTCSNLGAAGVDRTRVLGAMSCEMIAKAITDGVRERISLTDLALASCSVSEDGECGGVYTWGA